MARGLAARRDAPRSSHENLELAADRPDPIALLEQQGARSHRAADRPQDEIRRLLREARPHLHHDVRGGQERDDLDQQAESDVHGSPDIIAVTPRGALRFPGTPWTISSRGVTPPSA